MRFNKRQSTLLMKESVLLKPLKWGQTLSRSLARRLPANSVCPKIIDLRFVHATIGMLSER
ncbi:hypothetical protein DPMN_139025 [Dreissena polymorpha]|uniref:Uncharacterized protein n=1 Tax=Dreissena polymorpha TaxID=45954 RepID=A0A9D4G596_DREPO|nr:hypothetical protein DPMN_139025 [Dreissena polymorpha]